MNMFVSCNGRCSCLCQKLCAVIIKDIFYISEFEPSYLLYPPTLGQSMVVYQFSSVYEINFKLIKLCS